jgi:hypothetical protein
MRPVDVHPTKREPAPALDNYVYFNIMNLKKS